MGNSGMKRHKISTDMVVPTPRANEEDLGFAFNDFDFSDRVLRLEIIPDDNSKLILRGEKYHKLFSSINAYYGKDHKLSCDGAKAVTLHINSAILAAKSPFFYHLFKNGMGESQHKNNVSLTINASGEAALMDLLNFVYRNNLRATSAPDLVNVLTVANKFEVTSCVRYCIERLLKLPMSLKYASLYLELPAPSSASEIVKPLVDAATKYVAADYNDFFTKSQEKAMKLPLSAVEVILKREGLQVTSEDDVFDFIMKWARLHYPVLEERQEILSKRLAPLICFPNLSRSKLKQVLVSSDFDHDQASNLLVEALFSKVELSRGQHIHVSQATTNYGRIYRPRCVIYFDLKRDELKSLFPSKQLRSQSFLVGGRSLYLSVHCFQEKQNHCLGLFVNKAQGSKTCTLDYEFAVMNKSSNEFQSKHKATNIYFGGSPAGWGRWNVLGIPWTELMRDDNDYFINDILRLRADITLVSVTNSKP